MNANPWEVAFRWRYAFTGLVFTATLFLVSQSFAWWSIDTDRGIQTSLPPNLPSQQAEALYKQAFSRDLMSNSLFVVLRRTGRSGGLRGDDRDFIEDTLQPALLELSVPNKQSAHISLVKNVRTSSNKYIGSLLDSDDGQATLVAVELVEGLDDQQILQAVYLIERLIAQQGPLASTQQSLFQKGVVPPGLSMEMSGMACFTRDINHANKESAKSIELWALLGLGVVLIITQKSPVLVVIPLLVVFLAVHSALGMLTLTTELGWLVMYSDLRCYAAVVFTGVAAEHCLRLLTRYRNQIENRGRSESGWPNWAWADAQPILSGAFAMVAVLATLLFAEFGRFQQIGWVLLVGLVIVWVAVSLLTLGVILILQHWIFWPNRSKTRISTRRSWLRSSNVNELGSPESSGGGFLGTSPRTMCGVAIGVLLPFAVVAVLGADRTTYSLLNVLPIHAPSVVGAEAVQRHYPPGATSPITILLEDQNVEFNSVDGKKLVANLTECMASASDTHGILDVRSVAYPLGVKEEREIKETVPFRIIRHRAAVAHYVSDQGRWNGHVTKLDVIVDENPFSRSGFREFERLQDMVHSCLPAELSRTRVHFLGATARIHDLHTVDQRDQLIIQLASIVVAVVFSLLSVQRVSVACVLVCSGLLSWLATMGVCEFILHDVVSGGPFELDWQVVTLSFAILYALVFPGNLILAQRLLSSSSRGSDAISLGGWAMVACLLSLFASDVLGLQQLGLAMVVGMVITTTLIRPLFIPSWMRLLTTDGTAEDGVDDQSRTEGDMQESETEFAGTDSVG